MSEVIYNPQNGEVIKTWDNCAKISYLGANIKLDYQTEPPHGDFIYSVELEINHEEYSFPFWVYGRNLLFYDSYIVMECMEIERSYHNPLWITIIDINQRRIVVIKEWYCEFMGKNGHLYLSNKHTHLSRTIKDYNELNWISLKLKCSRN